MNRQEFLTKAIRYALASGLAVLMALLGKKAVFARDCTGCPDLGRCTLSSCTK